MKIVPIQFLMPEHIFVDAKIMLLGQLGEKLRQDFWHLKKINQFSKTAKQIFNRPQVEYFGQRKSRYHENCAHSNF